MTSILNRIFVKFIFKYQGGSKIQPVKISFADFWNSQAPSKIRASKIVVKKDLNNNEIDFIG